VIDDFQWFSEEKKIVLGFPFKQLSIALSLCLSFSDAKTSTFSS